MPWLTYSVAMDFVRPTTAALVVPYRKRLGAPFTDEQAEDMFTMLPRCRSSMPGMKACATFHMARTFSAKPKSHS